MHETSLLPVRRIRWVIDGGTPVMRSVQAFGSVLQVTPAWVRPCAIGLVALVHAAVIFGVPWQKPDDLAVPASLQIDVVAGGEPAHADQAVDAKQSDEQVGEVKPVETPPAEVKPAEDDVAPQEVAEAKPVPETSPAPAPAAENSPAPPEAKQIVAAEQVPAATDSRNALAMTAPSIKSEELHPDAPPATAPPRPQHSAPDPRDIQREQKRKEQAEKRKEQADKIKHDQAAAPARVASRAGTEAGRGETGTASGAISAADYASLVSAEITRHSHYPEAASPATGTVLLSFTIGPAGRVTSSSIVQSSGHGVLDSAARQTLAELSLPPPPGGRFTKTVPLRFRPQ
jgi:protein TonB